MDFLTKVKENLDTELTITENGALQYNTSNSKLLDMHFNVSGYRKRSNSEIINNFTKVYAENPELAIKWLFYIGDIRKGLGERRLFQTILNWLGNNDINAVNKIVSYIGEYNRFDALLSLFDTDSENISLEEIKRQLNLDLEKYEKNESISLLAKWLPSINTSSQVRVKQAKKLAKFLNMSEKTYRTTLSKLRTYIDVIEKKMVSNNWELINYSSVPSKANLRYKDAFLKHDEGRRKAFISELAEGKTKINSSTCFPHDIVYQYQNANEYGRCAPIKFDQIYESMWQSLPNTVTDANNILVVRDGSGSMDQSINNDTKAKVLDVATALSIYFAERQDGPFKNKFITFSSTPEIVDMSKLDSLNKKITLCNTYTDCSNTNIEKTMMLVLDTAIKNNLKQNEIPTLLIISDMEFDSATINYSDNDQDEEKRICTLFEHISSKYKSHGYELPKMVFWRVNGSTNGIPLKTNKSGVILVSGYSTSVVNMILSNELDPIKALIKILLGERYSKISLNGNNYQGRWSSETFSITQLTEMIKNE